MLAVKPQRDRWLYRVVLPVSATLAVLLAPGLPAAEAATATIKLAAPFSGYWDKFGISGPSYHYSSGDWSVDFFSNSGTEVKARFNPGTTVSMKLKVVSVSPTCGTAGKTVKVDVYGNGTRLGWAS